MHCKYCPSELVVQLCQARGGGSSRTTTTTTSSSSGSSGGGGRSVIKGVEVSLPARASQIFPLSW